MQNGCTALICACTNGHDKVVQLLVDAGANKDIQDQVSTVHYSILDPCILPIIALLCGSHRYLKKTYITLF